MARRIPSKLEVSKKAAGPPPATQQVDLELKPVTAPVFHSEVTTTKHVFDSSLGKVSVTMEELRKKVYKDSKKKMTMVDFVKGKFRISKPKDVTGADLERLWKQFAKEIEKELPAPAPVEEPIDGEDPEDSPSP